MNTYQSFLSSKVVIDQRALLDQTFQSAIKKFDKNKKNRYSSKYTTQNYSLNSNTSANRTTSQPYITTRLPQPLSEKNYNTNVTLSATKKSDENSAPFSISSKYNFNSSKLSSPVFENENEIVDKEIFGFNFEPNEKSTNYLERFSSNVSLNDESGFQFTPNNSKSIIHKKENKYSTQFHSPQLYSPEPQCKPDLQDNFQEILQDPISPLPSCLIEIKPSLNNNNQDEQITSAAQTLPKPSQEQANQNKEEEIQKFRELLKKRISLKKENDTEEQRPKYDKNQRYQETKKTDQQYDQSTKQRKITNLPQESNSSIRNVSINNIKQNEISPVAASKRLTSSPNEFKMNQVSKFNNDENELLSPLSVQKMSNKNIGQSINIKNDFNPKTEFSETKSIEDDIFGIGNYSNNLNFQSGQKSNILDFNDDEFAKIDIKTDENKFANLDILRNEVFDKKISTEPDDLFNNMPNINDFDSKNYISPVKYDSHLQNASIPDSRTFSSRNNLIGDKIDQNSNVNLNLDTGIRNIDQNDDFRAILGTNTNIESKNAGITSYNVKRNAITNNTRKDIDPQQSKIAVSNSAQISNMVEQKKQTSFNFDEMNPKINQSRSFEETKTQNKSLFNKEKEHKTPIGGIKKENEIISRKLLDSRPTDLINAFKQRMLNFTSKTVGSPQIQNNENRTVETLNPYGINSSKQQNEKEEFLEEDDQLISFDEEDLNFQFQSHSESMNSFNENEYNLSDGNGDDNIDSTFFLQLKDFSNVNTDDFLNIEADIKKDQNSNEKDESDIIFFND